MVADGIAAALFATSPQSSIQDVSERINAP
jgi:hypothetical protein